MNHNNTSHTGAQLVYFSHGGGPLPILGDPGHQAMVDFMDALPDRIRRPEAIIFISAHWEEKVATLLSGRNPPLLYDYYGFPEEAYSVRYPAPGNPELAEKVFNLLEKQNIPVRLDPVRGFDHGLFIPLKMMYPEADIPALQLSLLQGLNPAAHIAMGRALRELLQEKILVIGSGFSFHNMMEFDMQGSNQPNPQNDAFQDWLINVCTGEVDQSEREKLLVNWQEAPHARYCHPREEHLLPLHVCVGMAGKPAEVVFDDYILSKRALAFLW